MTTRKRNLGLDELRLATEIGESSKAFGVWPDSPDMVPIEVAVRAAEMAYRRGVTQGAYFMLWHLRGERGYRPEDQGEVYAKKLWSWRVRGRQQKYAVANLPPAHLSSMKGTLDELTEEA